MFWQRFLWVPGAQMNKEKITNQKRERTPCTDWLCAGTLLHHLAALALSLGISLKWKLKVFSGLSWAWILPRHVDGCLKSPMYIAVLNILISKKLKQKQKTSPQHLPQTLMVYCLSPPIISYLRCLHFCSFSGSFYEQCLLLFSELHKMSTLHLSFKQPPTQIG